MGRKIRTVVLALGVAGMLVLSAQGVIAVVEKLSGSNGRVRIAQVSLEKTVPDGGLARVGGLKTTITTSEGGLILATLTAKTRCTDSSTGGCSLSLEIKADDEYLQPTSSLEFLSSRGAASGSDSGSIQRAIDDMPAGSHEVYVEASCSSDDECSLYDAQLTVQAFS